MYSQRHSITSQLFDLQMEVSMALFCDYTSLETESDVEQKLIYPILTSAPPMGLGLKDTEILTKSVLRRKLIGKGQKQKYYYPDYLVTIRGIPILILEAKKPGEPLGDAYAEARLYATEVNSGFVHSINTCQLIVVCNGDELWAGYSDQATPEITIKFDEICVENKNYTKFLDLCAIDKLKKIADAPYKSARGKAIFSTPVSNLGGKRVQNEELEENSFGRTFVLENRKIFDPETEAERALIVENAYVPSAKREQHIEPMYKEIRKFEIPSFVNTTALATSEPNSLVQKISQRIERHDEAYSLLLLVGNVGSGKTTFVRYFQRVFMEKQHPELAARCDWVFANMNMAPLSRDEIYDWLKNTLIDQLKSNHADINFSLIDNIKKLFRKEIIEFDSGIGSLLAGDESQYNKELFKLLQSKLSDNTQYLHNLLFFLKENFGIVPIVVLDNCDKRNKEEQLLMFEVAQWLRDTFKCLVILPMRDSTFDQYKDEPPLDTVVKDLVFRIDPPDLLKVIQARLDYIVRLTEQTDTTYVLQNGMNVSIKKEELIEYFKCILLAIRNNRMISNIFYRLSDRNTRNGIQVFEDFCKSGHIQSDDIFMIRTAGKEFQMPSYKFMNALLRKNRRYYNGEQSNFVNLFYSNYSDDFPDPFIRVDILSWLKLYKDEVGPSKFKGMFPAADLLRDMQIIGHDLDVAHRELNYLIKRGLILSENQSNSVAIGDLVKITLPGLLHLGLLSNVTYLAACAEDTLFKNTVIMTTISRRIASEGYLSKAYITLTANDLVQYLISYRNEFCASPKSYICDDKNVAIFDLSECINAVDKSINEDPYIKTLLDGICSFPTGTKVSAKVIRKEANLLICSFADERKGFLSTYDSKYCLSAEEHTSIEIGEVLNCEIIEYAYDHNNFQLRLLHDSDEA